jgi:hypothetical protein
MPHGAVYDDGFVWFELESFTGNVKGKRVAEGWAPKVHARLFGADIPKRSALKFVYKAGRKKIGEIRCELSFMTDGYTEKSKPQWHVHRCQDRKQRIKKKGKISVDVLFIDGDDDKETKIHSHAFEVTTLSRVRGNGEKDAPVYYINRNAEVAASLIYQLPRSEYGYLSKAASGRGLSRFDFNTVEIYINSAPSQWNGDQEKTHPKLTASGAFFRCTVDGEKLKLDTDEVKIKEFRHVYEIMTWGRGRRSERDQVSYRQYRLLTPFTWGETKREWRQGWLKLKDHPGKWACDLKNNGELIRSFTWTVDAAGMILPHPEESQGLSLAGAHFVETVIPKKTTRETRVDKKAPTKNGIFYGYKPKSAEIKKMIKALPKVGSPLPKKRR